MKITDKGFLLFEVMVSIVIITTALLFIVRAYSVAKDSIRRSGELFKTTLLLENKLWGLDDKGKIEEGSDNGDFIEAEGYSWESNVERIEDSELHLVTITVFLARDREHTEYSMQTILGNDNE